MDNMKDVQSEHLRVNKMGKSIRKSPLYQPNFCNNSARQQPQPQPRPQVYNISKNDFRIIVQQLTGSPSQEPLSRPPQKPQSRQMQRIRPPPLLPMNRPQMPPPVPNNSFIRPFGAYAGDSQPSAGQFPPLTLGNVFWKNSSESPISANRRYLETSMAGPSPRGNLGQPPLQPLIQSQNAAQLLADNPTNPPPPNLPSPTSQFLLPCPNFYSNLVSPLLSPGIGFSPLLSPNFSFSPLAHPPPSPGLFPLWP